jgi:hypothetical protein
MDFGNPIFKGLYEADLGLQKNVNLGKGYNLFGQLIFPMPYTKGYMNL